MTAEDSDELQAETENDVSNDGDDTEDPDNEAGPGGNSAKTPVSLLQVGPHHTYRILSEQNVNCGLPSSNSLFRHRTQPFSLSSEYY